jgi:hypothetical protein
VPRRFDDLPNRRARNNDIFTAKGFAGDLVEDGVDGPSSKISRPRNLVRKSRSARCSSRRSPGT